MNYSTLLLLYLQGNGNQLRVFEHRNLFCLHLLRMQLPQTQRDPDLHLCSTEQLGSHRSMVMQHTLQNLLLIQLNVMAAVLIMDGL